jgi:hypothetical protein
MRLNTATGTLSSLNPSFLAAVLHCLLLAPSLSIIPSSRTAKKKPKIAVIRPSLPAFLKIHTHYKSRQSRPFLGNDWRLFLFLGGLPLPSVKQN